MADKLISDVRTGTRRVVEIPADVVRAREEEAARDREERQGRLTLEQRIARIEQHLGISIDQEEVS